MGTGLYCVGPNRDLFADPGGTHRQELLADHIDTTFRVFLGLNVQCARCHDHKYDPIPQRDYDRLQAIFAPAVKTRIPIGPASREWDLSENAREIKLRELGEEIASIEARCSGLLHSRKLAGLPSAVREAFTTEEYGARRNSGSCRRFPEARGRNRQRDSRVPLRGGNQAASACRAEPCFHVRRLLQTLGMASPT